MGIGEGGTTENTPEVQNRGSQPPRPNERARPIPCGCRTRPTSAAAAVAHLSSCRASRASPCAPPPRPPPRLRASPPPSSPSQTGAVAFASAAAAAAACEHVAEKPAICTADELHYAPVPGTEWRLALWRYRPPPEVMSR